MIKIYGKDDVTVAIEGSDYSDKEIGCYESVVEFILQGGTVVAFAYIDGEWKIDVLRIGEMPYKINKIEHAFYSKAEIVSHVIVDSYEWGGKDAVQK